MKFSLHRIAPAALVFAASIGSAKGHNDHVSNIRKLIQDQANIGRALEYEEPCPYPGNPDVIVAPEDDGYENCVAVNDFFSNVMLAEAVAVSEKSTSDKDFMQCFNADIEPGFIAAFLGVGPTDCEGGKVLVNPIYTLTTEDGSKSIMADWFDQTYEPELCIDFENNCDYNDLNGWLKSTIVPFSNFAHTFLFVNEDGPFPYPVVTDHFLMTASCNAKAFGFRSSDNSTCLSYSSDNDCGYPVCTDGCYGSADAYFSSYDVGDASMPVDDFKKLVALRYCPDKKKGKSSKSSKGGKKGKKSKSPKA